jgi:hypothetical protein
MNKTNNLVAKHARKFNKAVVMKDRKKAQKKGDRKHKGKYEENKVSEDKKGLWVNIRAKSFDKKFDEGEDISEDLRASPPREKPKKVGQKATTPSEMGRKYPDNKWVAKKNTGTSKAYRPLEWVLESVQQVDEELTTMQKRKHINLKKRAKQGNSQAKIRLKKFEQEFASDLDANKRSAKQSSKSIKGKGAADPHSGQAFTGKGSGAGSDDNLIIQLRKAQDVNGKLDIKVTPTGKTTRLSKQVIDKLLAGYDKMQKPDEKRKFKILLTKQLRKQAK